MRLTLAATTVPLAALAAALPVVERQFTSQDPAFTLSEDQLASFLVCPGATPDTVTNPILLVPGTGSTGEDSFGQGYSKLVPELGFQPCTTSPPNDMLGDIQENAEYVAYAINRLASAAGKPIKLLGWSQGNLATQWALTFYPSTRSNVDGFVSLAGDFAGVAVANIGLGAPAIIQQGSGSNFIAALKAGGGDKVWVPTTSIRSQTDEVVQPTSSSILPGAVNVRIQDYCPLKIVLHATQLHDGFVYGVAKQALLSPTGQADPALIEPICDGDAPGLTLADTLKTETATEDAVLAIVGNLLLTQFQEPPLQPFAAAALAASLA